MMRVLIRHTDILTLDATNRVLTDAAIAIADGSIVAVGAAPADFVADEIVDATGHIAMPGFFNAHTHSPMTLLRGQAVDRPLDDWLRERIWPAEVGLTAEDVYWGAALAAVEMIRSGVVGFADHYFFMDQVAKVVLESGLRANLAWCVFGREEGELGADLPTIARFVEEWQDAGGGRIHTMLGPHSPSTCPAQFLARTAAVAARLGVGIHIHVAESRAELARSLATYNMSPIELLSRSGVFDVPVLAAHGIYLAHEDLEFLAAHDVAVVHCPTSQMRLGMGLTPVTRLQQADIPVALGSESPASSGRFSILREARLALLAGQGGSTGGEAGTAQTDGPSLSAAAVLRMATQVGARASGFPFSGELAPGRSADLILLDARAAHLIPRHDVAESVLMAAGDADVSDVMVAGRWLMRNRQVLTLDEGRIMHEVARRGLRYIL